MRKLRIAQKRRRHRESRSPGDFRQPGNAERTTDATRTPKDAGCKLGKSGELTRPSREHQAAARFRGKRRERETVANHLEDLLGARLDDARELGPRHETWPITVLAADHRYGDHVAFIPPSPSHTALHR